MYESVSVASHETLQCSSFLITSNYFVFLPFQIPFSLFFFFLFAGLAVALVSLFFWFFFSFFRPAGLGSSQYKYEKLFASFN